MTHNIGKGTKSKLTDYCSCAGSQLDGGIRLGRHFAHAGVVNYAQHGCQKRHGEDVVRVREETNTGYKNSSHVVPAKGGLIDLGQGEATTLVWVLDVSLEASQFCKPVE